MNKYIITRDVNTKILKAKDVFVGLGEVFENNPFVGAAAVAGAGAGFAIMYMHDKAIIKITSDTELMQYRNGISYEWKTETLYVEHPFRKNVLIEAALYEDYILREMVSDLANYIADHMNLSKLVIGLVVSDKTKGSVKIPVQSLNAEASMECSLDQNYTIKMEDTKMPVEKRESYLWVNQFPDVKSAIGHQSGKMEVRKKITMDLDVKGGIGKVFQGALRKKNNYEFYISYAKAKDKEA